MLNKIVPNAHTRMLTRTMMMSLVRTGIASEENLLGGSFHARLLLFLRTPFSLLFCYWSSDTSELMALVPQFLLYGRGRMVDSRIVGIARSVRPCKPGG